MQATESVAVISSELHKLDSWPMLDELLSAGLSLESAVGVMIRMLEVS